VLEEAVYVESDPEMDDSQLFLVRLWAWEVEGAGGTAPSGQRQVSGKVQHVLSGKAEHFSNWQSLLDLLNRMMSATGAGAESRFDKR
jgi:hypothetical protein